jgi:hypothetical protein
MDSLAGALDAYRQFVVDDEDDDIESGDDDDWD